MALFWAGDALAIWSALAAFGFVMNGPALLVGYCTGMVFTRRVAPLAGAGTLTLILPLTIWASGAPLATAITAIAAYRLLGWLSLPPALASLPVLRETSARPRPCPASATDQRSGGDREARRCGPRCQGRCLVARPEGRGEQGQAERDDDRSPGPWAGPE